MIKALERWPALGFLLAVAACSGGVDEHGTTPLMRAARDGDAPRLVALLEGGAAYDAQVSKRPFVELLRSAFFLEVPSRDEGYTALMYAISSRHREIALKLLEAGTDPNLGERSGLRPLDLAVVFDDEELIRRLLEAGARVEGGPMVGCSAQVCRLLLDAGGDPNARHGGTTPLLAAAARGEVPLVRLLLERGADPNQRHASTGASPLQLATRGGHAEVAELLRRADANEEGLLEDALFAAVTEADVERVREGLAKGASANARSDSGTPVLVEAAARGLTEVVRMLLSGGASPVATDSISRSPLAVAAGNGHLEVVTSLVAAGAPVAADERALLSACAGRRLDVLRALLDAGADVRARRGECLRLAVQGESLPLVEEILARGVDVDAKDGIGMTALMRAAGSAAITRRLLAAGADVDVRNASGTTALIFAAAVGRPEVVRLLLEAGADASIRDDDGSTALSEARRMRYDAVIATLEAAAR